MNYLAIDLGAESGRVILGSLEGGKISLREIHRFPNGASMRDGSLLWDFEKLLAGVERGIELAKQTGVKIQSVSADSWGVDYVLNGDVKKVFAYRDARGKLGVEKFLKRVPWEKVFEETGIQFMPINTLFQLAAEKRPICGESAILGVADYVNHWLGGRAVIEESMASTFQIYNPRTRDWSDTLLRELGVPKSAMGPVVPSGTVLGECRLISGAKVIVTCSHDTGAAVAAVPATGGNWAYLSSGTWSLMGVERAEPIINDLARELNFTNEVGFGGSIRLLKNISGLWLLQECRRNWAAQGKSFDYAELTRLAEAEKGEAAVIDPMDDRFLAPTSMVQAIQGFCREKALPTPETPAAITRCIFESLAQLYARTLKQLEDLVGARIERLHVVGGGSKNDFLNRMTAKACGIPVLAGPVEATALGNVLIQAIVSGEIPHLKKAREVISSSFPAIPFP